MVVLLAIALTAYVAVALVRNATWAAGDSGLFARPVQAAESNFQGQLLAGDSVAPLVVDWSRGNSRPANPTGARWNAPPIGNPQFFEQRPLRAYVLAWE